MVWTKAEFKTKTPLLMRMRGGKGDPGAKEVMIMIIIITIIKIISISWSSSWISLSIPIQHVTCIHHDINHNFIAIKIYANGRCWAPWVANNDTITPIQSKCFSTVVHWVKKPIVGTKNYHFNVFIRVTKKSSLTGEANWQSSNGTCNQGGEVVLIITIISLATIILIIAINIIPN